MSPDSSVPYSGRWSRSDVESVLGQPLFVDDPMLTTRQAAALLGVDTNRLHYLVRTCRVTPSRRGRWPWRLSDLQHIEQVNQVNQVNQRSPQRGAPTDPAQIGRIPTREAAKLLGISRHTFYKWAATGKVTAVRDSTGMWWARPKDLATARQHLDAERHPAPTVQAAGAARLDPDDQPDDQPDDWRLNPGSEPDPAHAGRVPSAEAAKILGISRQIFARRAADGRMPAVRDRRGRWWAQPEDLAMIRRAQEARFEPAPKRAQAPDATGAELGPEPDPVHSGRVPATKAAALLGVPRSTWHLQASAGRLPAVQDSAGRWWARPADMAMLRRARAAAAEHRASRA